MDENQDIRLLDHRQALNIILSATLDVTLVLIWLLHEQEHAWSRRAHNTALRFQNSV
jgi:hypothetical protein